MTVPTDNATDNAAAWDRYASEYQASAKLPTDVARYGPDVPTETELRLCGNVEGKRVLDLGCGAAQTSIAFAKRGARTTAVDFSSEQLAHAKRLVATEKVRVELHHGDLADLAFIRADQVDLAFSAGAFGYVADLDRVFRQVHRVLKQEAPFVFSLPHPAYAMIDDRADPALLVRRAYYDRTPIEVERGGVTFTHHHHTISSLFTSLTRANFRVDTLLEPEPATGGTRSPEWNDAFRDSLRKFIARHRIGARRAGVRRCPQVYRPSSAPLSCRGRGMGAISTRRLRARPASSRLEPTGCCAPKAAAKIESAGRPASIRARVTVSARCADSSQLSA